jgi:hypothetical protein
MMAPGPLTEALRARVGTRLDLIDTVLVVSSIPYWRPPELRAADVLSAWRGTCSTKHLLLAGLVEETWPEIPLSLWHRVYTVYPDRAATRWGPDVAATIPEVGLVDVHTFARAQLDSGPVVIDVTFPVSSWDGHSDIPLACGPGVDHHAGPEPLKTKAELVALHCEHEVRELFIAALAEHCG